MKFRNEMLSEQLKSIDPVDGEDLGRPQDPAATELLQAILATDPRVGDEGRPARAPRRTLTGKRMLTAVAIPGLAALAVIVGLPGGGDGANDAVTALDRVAEAAASQPPPVADLPYLYLKTKGVYLNTSIANGHTWSVVSSEVREEWAAKDGSGRLRRVLDVPKFASPGARAAWEAADKIPFLAYGFKVHTEDRSVPPGSLGDRTYGEDLVPLAEIPTDATGLSTFLGLQAEKGGGSAPIPAKILDLMAGMLRDPSASPELRAALYEVAKEIPGIEYFGEATDEVGREGLAVGVVSGYSGLKTAYSLIYDPDTSEVLATEQRPLEAPAVTRAEEPPPTSATIYLDSGSTNSVTETP